MEKKDITGNIPSIFDGAGDIEKTVSKESVQELEDKVEKRKLKAVDVNEFMQKIRTKPIVRDHKKIQRNDPCPCGSGKKYKNCCMRDGTYETTHQLDD